MAQELDEDFYSRADEHIHLSNDQISDAIERGKVSASMMYATTRFISWVSACEYQSGAQMEEAKEQTIKYFVEQYRLMLEQNLDDYIENFDKYMSGGS